MEVRAPQLAIRTPETCPDAPVHVPEVTQKEHNQHSQVASNCSNITELNLDYIVVTDASTNEVATSCSNNTELELFVTAVANESNKEGVKTAATTQSRAPIPSLPRTNQSRMWRRTAVTSHDWSVFHSRHR